MLFLATHDGAGAHHGWPKCLNHAGLRGIQEAPERHPCRGFASETATTSPGPVEQGQGIGEPGFSAPYCALFSPQRATTRVARERRNYNLTCQEHKGAPELQPVRYATIIPPCENHGALPHAPPSPGGIRWGSACPPPHAGRVFIRAPSRAFAAYPRHGLRYSTVP